MLLLELLSIYSHFELIFLEASSVFTLLNSVFFWGEARRTCDLKVTQYKVKSFFTYTLRVSIKVCT